MTPTSVVVKKNGAGFVVEELFPVRMIPCLFVPLHHASQLCSLEFKSVAKSKISSNNVESSQSHPKTQFHRQFVIRIQCEANP
jgi:hypothetical protein